MPPRPPKPDARLLWPRTRLSSLLVLAVVRDTRGLLLTEEQKYNCFPATPLCTVTWVRTGQLHLVRNGGGTEPEPLPRCFVSGPFRLPLKSWSETPVYAMTLAIYPDAWTSLTGGPAGRLIDRHVPLEAVLDGPLYAAFNAVSDEDDFPTAFEVLQNRFDGLWSEKRPRGATPPLLADWVRALSARAAVAGGGARQIQRRVKDWTGQSLRELRLYARFDSLSARSRPLGGKIADTAAEAGYSDQSHMGREVRRMTGQSPALIRRMVATDERYWAYRLLEQERSVRRRDSEGRR